MSRCQSIRQAWSWFRGDYVMQCDQEEGHEGQHRRLCKTSTGSEAWAKWDDAEGYQ